MYDFLIPWIFRFKIFLNRRYHVIHDDQKESTNPESMSLGVEGNLYSFRYGMPSRLSQ